MRHVVVTGLMGAGKTTVARGVASARNLPVRDSDVDIHQLFGVDGRTFAAREGVDELHRLEAAVLLGALAAEHAQVIAAAGWVVEDASSRLAMQRRAHVVVLEASPADLMGRWRRDDHRRPVSLDDLEAMARRRQPLFDELADQTLDAMRPVEELVAAIVDATAPS